MNLKLLKEPFPERDIEWRIGSSGKGTSGVWATCLAYISARAIQDRLDEVCGPENWRVSYRFIPISQEMRGGVICELSIRINDQWVCKEDGAEQTEYEAFKGGLSSAIKRAGAVWGIGRYLYLLESDYADISMQKISGCRHGQLKDKTDFYWAPPRLPDWALRDDEKSSVSQKEVKQFVPSNPGSPGEVLVPFGKYKDRQIKELSVSIIDADIKYWEDRAAKEGKPLSRKVSEYVAACKAYRETANAELGDLPF